MPLTVKGAARGRPVKVSGSAAFSACDARRACHRAKSVFSGTFIP
jgi:hypothetical protein